jgi:hypothetical protein
MIVRAAGIRIGARILGAASADLFRYHSVVATAALCLFTPSVVGSFCSAPPVFQAATQSTMKSLVIVQVPCLQDNYGYILHDPVTQCTAVVDTPEATPYRRELKERGWKLTHILNTHQYVYLMLMGAST